MKKLKEYIDNGHLKQCKYTLDMITVDIEHVKLALNFVKDIDDRNLYIDGLAIHNYVKACLNYIKFVKKEKKR